MRIKYEGHLIICTMTKSEIEKYREGEEYRQKLWSLKRFKG